MKTKHVLIKGSLTLGLIVATAQSAMAGDGTLGASSTGTSNLSVTTTEMVQITNVANITVNPFVPSSSFPAFDNVCIFSNDSTGPAGYKVTATGQSGSGGTADATSFKIQDATGGAGHTIAYTVKWNDATGGGGTSLTANTISPVFTGGNTYPCVTNNASFEVNITDAAALSVPAGAYTGTLTMVIVPDPA